MTSTFRRRSLCLYTTLGFRTRELLSSMNGPSLKRILPGFQVRAAMPADLQACNVLCFDVHGFERHGELIEAIEQGTATVAERNGQITGTPPGWASSPIA